MNPLRLSGALLLGATFAHASSSHAQAAPLEQQVAPEKSAIQTAQIKVRNVPSNLMVYWLDPNHQPIPVQIQQSIANSGKFPQLQHYDFSTGNLPAVSTVPKAEPLKLRPNNGYGPLNLKLPEGIETVVLINPQNVILVRGTATGIEQLRALVAQLDVPLQQVEIEVQFCQLARADLSLLGLSFVGDNPVAVETAATASKNQIVPPNQSNRVQIGFIRGNLTAKITDLLVQNKLKIINAPRVSAISGLTAELKSDETRAFAGSALSANWNDETKESGILPPGAVLTTTETGITCTPLVYKDLVQLDLEASLQNRLLNLRTTIENGETLAVQFPAENANSKTLTVLFITARIMRSAGE